MSNAETIRNRGKSTRIRSGEEAAEKGRAGGIKSGESRRKKKMIKDIAQKVLATTPKFNIKSESDRKFMKIMKERYGLNDLSDVDIQEIAMYVIAGKALKGNEQSLKFLLEQAQDEASINLQKEKMAFEREKMEFEKRRFELLNGMETQYKPDQQIIEMYKLLNEPLPNRTFEQIENSGNDAK